MSAEQEGQFVPFNCEIHLVTETTNDGYVFIAAAALDKETADREVWRLARLAEAKPMHRRPVFGRTSTILIQ